MNSMNGSMALGASAMTTQAWGMAVAAHNVANVSTAGFEPQVAHYATGPAGQGVRLAAITQGQGLGQTLGGAGTSSPWSAATAVYDVTGGLPPEAMSPSGTDLTRETVRMLSTQHAYAANAAVVRTSDAMLGTLLDIRA